jgi:hypothetical protein
MLSCVGVALEGLMSFFILASMGFENSRTVMLLIFSLAAKRGLYIVDLSQVCYLKLQGRRIRLN